MLKTTRLDPTTVYAIACGEDSIIDKVGNSKIDGAKVGSKTAKFKIQDINKGKNLVKSFLLSPKFLALERVFLFSELDKPLLN